MLKSIEYLAEVSVARGCGFASLGIVTLMIGLIDLPHTALKAGGILTLAMSAILWVRGLGATRMSYKRTELWIMLDADHRPPPEIAQQLIGGALRATFLRFALHSGYVSVMMLAASLILALRRTM